MVGNEWKTIDSESLPKQKRANGNEIEEDGLDLEELFTVLRLDKALASMRRRWLLMTGVTTATLLGAVGVGLPTALTDVYVSKVEILTEPTTPEKDLVSSVFETLGDEQIRNQLSSNRRENLGDETRKKVLKSPGLLSPVIEQLQQQYPGMDYETLVESLSVEMLVENNVLAVAYASRDPKQVEDVVELVGQAYLNYSLEQELKDIRQAIAFVEQQIPQIRSKVNEQQEKMQKFQLEYNLIDPEITVSELSTKINTLEQKQIDNKLQLDEVRLGYTSLEKDLAEKTPDAVTAMAVTQDPSYQQIMNRLLEIDMQIAKESVLFLDGSPRMEILRQERENMLGLLRRQQELAKAELASKIAELEGRTQILNQTIAQLNDQRNVLHSVGGDYADIKRDVEIANQNLNEFLALREGLQIKAEQREAPWQLLVPASDPEALPKNLRSLRVNVIVGLILGLLLGAGSALVVDNLNKVIRGAKEVQEIANLPLLGLIPFEKQLGASVPTLQTGAFKSFHATYMNIRVLSSEMPIRSLAIASALGGEGKSTVAVHLAQAAATMEQSVLIVDTDLRNPSIHKHLDLENEQGLTDVIHNNQELKNVIQQVPGHENLFVITAGSIASDPIQTFSAQKMKEVMEKLEANFDLVVYDTPSLLDCADTYILAPHTSGVVLVAGLGKLKPLALEQAIDELKGVGTPILGTVVNQVVK
ncbi:MAG: polysaccharide biosynthesis tyrosine autokinase [Gomphosphaeria aponina SAG 52.96 = DSM 107014]|uniref:non-specific protein-tyrosine kinase n=1 Tax=Gomphosphaeria aponina SAG 52.96 = DSM 107014 TaxID=1521640 RepID=A0A941GNX2_9CHRO|nr:polysaccharide biosynthesis tyrosine autokinase [Gomphosphaeria aponina SAG 52.96 = DSM 107014]